MTTSRDFLPRLRSEDSGFTLVELLVAMALLAVVGGIVTAESVGALRTSRTVTGQAIGLADAREAVDRMSQTLRMALIPNSVAGASPFDVATNTDVVFYSALGTVTFATPAAAPGTVGPTRVEYASVAGGTGTGCAPGEQCLVETLTPTIWTADSTGAYAWRLGLPHSRVLVHGIQPGTPVATYYAAANSATAAPISVPTGGLDALGRAQIRSVQASVTIAPQPGATSSQVALSDRVVIIGWRTPAAVPQEVS